MVYINSLMELMMMFMTDSLRTEVRRSLTTMQVRLDWLKGLSQRDDFWWEDITLLWAAERALHVCLESATDAASSLIVGLVMRDPGSYEDIFRIMVDESVVPKEWFNNFTGALGLRERLIHKYDQLTANEVLSGVRQYPSTLQQFVEFMEKYLEVS
ncbi:DUF86 domain-containing protein [Alicyclobacillaceae bacterium I2511]|nr:DUF86 domain-containing protein [Alicyclobacillaceae bacterium I2511]